MHVSRILIGVQTADSFNHSINKGDTNAIPLLLLVKEAILDILGYNDEKYSKNSSLDGQYSLDFTKITNKIGMVIKATSIDEMIGLLDSNEILELENIFGDDFESRFLEIIGISSKGEIALELLKISISKAKKCSVNKITDSDLIHYLEGITIRTTESQKWKVYKLLAILYLNKGDFISAINNFSISLVHAPYNELHNIFTYIKELLEKLGLDELAEIIMNETIKLPSKQVIIHEIGSIFKIVREHIEKGKRGNY